MTSATFDAPGKGPWELDPTHFPRPATRFVADAMVAGMPRGFSFGTARFGLLLDYLQPGVVNGWVYLQPRAYLAPAGAKGPPPAPVLWLLTRLHPKMRDRIATSVSAFEDRRWREDLARWDEIDRPAAVQAHRAIAAVGVADLTDAELAAHLRRVHDHVEQMLELHHKYTAPAIVPTGDFLAGAQEWTGASARGDLGAARRFVADFPRFRRRRTRRCRRRDRQQRHCAGPAGTATRPRIGVERTRRRSGRRATDPGVLGRGAIPLARLRRG